MMTFGSISLRTLRVLCLMILAVALAGSFGAVSGWDDTARATLTERLDTPERSIAQGGRQAVLALASDDVQGGDDPLSGLVGRTVFDPAQGVRLAVTSSKANLRGQRFCQQTPIRAPPIPV
ncbi:hypothetical protein [Neptunicoccus sediminis]|uniref:hypothetical protein n=1 Tax=Neptunicoccus sediminis TaxID=1892596 RepID=UPI0008460935|nr:hypothetical protein [Neptunicoccus sediminis]